MPHIHSDRLSRRLYASDASMYEEMPMGVAYPESATDIQALVGKAAADGFTITARSGGTSLAGQTTGDGLIMDVSRHMRQIISIDPDRRIAHIQPGVIRDTLNREAGTYKLQFGPDTATANRCMIGGMIGNNSCGLFSIRYGTTRDHLLEVDAVLSDGSLATFKALSDEELAQKCQLNTLEGLIYRQMIELLQEHKQTIRDASPHPEIKRRNTGYALDRLCEMSPITEGGRPFNLCELLCGSEGTLAMTTSAKVNLEPVDTHTLLVIPQFDNLQDALKATITAVEHDPSAVELVDDIILDATKGNIEQNRNRFFLDGEPSAILIIQFDGEDPAELQQRAARLTSALKTKNHGYAWPVVSQREMVKRVWDLRKAGLGLLMGLGADNRSPTFVEDTAVRVADLPDYVMDFKKILEKYHTRCVFYAHASVGELHIRPVIDTANDAGLQTLKAMAQEVALLVKKYRGSLSGEHGDGRARSPYIETVLGTEMVSLLRRVKEIWDPGYIFNPGKIVSPKPIEDGLRFKPGYLAPEIDTVFHWRREKGFGRALEQCNGAGACRKLPGSGGTMCPSYHATLDEKDSTRGRANVFRHVFNSPGGPVDGFNSSEIREALELCLSCKACKSECPANVDMARMKAEFSHGWHTQNGIGLADRFFGEPEKFYPLASRVPSLTNALMASSPVKAFMSGLIGLDNRRPMPAFAPKTFRKWFTENRHLFQKQRHRKVALLADLFTDYHDPEIAKAACRLFDVLGYDVILLEIHSTGRPQISRGLLSRAAELCESNIEALSPLVSNGIPIIGLEPSELLTLRDEYLDLCSDKSLKKAQAISKNSYLFEEFLLNHLLSTPDDIQHFQTGGTRVSLHGHCHTKALVGNGPLLDLLELIGFEADDMNTGCCGMAGSFGYESKSYDVSMKIGEQVLFPAVRNAGKQTVICAPGFSCRHQIADATGRQAVHPAQLLADKIS